MGTCIRVYMYIIIEWLTLVWNYTFEYLCTRTVPTYVRMNTLCIRIRILWLVSRIWYSCAIISDLYICTFAGRRALPGVLLSKRWCVLENAGIRYVYIFNGWIHHDRRTIVLQVDCKNFTFNYRISRWFSGIPPENPRNSLEISQKFPDAPQPTSPTLPGTSNQFFSIVRFPSNSAFSRDTHMCSLLCSMHNGSLVFTTLFSSNIWIYYTYCKYTYRLYAYRIIEVYFAYRNLEFRLRFFVVMIDYWVSTQYKNDNSQQSINLLSHEWFLQLCAFAIVSFSAFPRRN